MVANHPDAEEPADAEAGHGGGDDVAVEFVLHAPPQVLVRQFILEATLEFRFSVLRR